MKMNDRIIPGVLYDMLLGAQCWIPWMIRTGFSHSREPTKGNMVLLRMSNARGCSLARKLSRTPGRYFGPKCWPARKTRAINVPIRKHHLNIGYIELNIRSEPSKPHMSELAYSGA